MAHKVIGYSYFGLKTIHMEKDLGIPKQSLWRRGSLLAWRKPALPATRCRLYINMHARSSFPAWHLTGGATYWLVMLPSNRIGGCVSWTPWTSPLLGKSWLQVLVLCINVEIFFLEFSFKGPCSQVSMQFGKLLQWNRKTKETFTYF